MNSKEKSKHKPGPLVSFFRYNLVALLATGIDFLLLISMTELLKIWYLISTVIAAICGAITAFLLGRHWVFLSVDSKVQTQAFRYFLAAIGSILLNSFGVFVLTEYANFQYFFSKIVASVFVAIAYNYFISRHFVFR